MGEKSQARWKYEEETAATLRDKGTEEIDALISPSFWCRRLPRCQVVSAFDTETKRLCQEFAADNETLHRREEVAYGDTERQRFDVLSGTQIDGSGPTFIFFHGGYWSAMNRQQFCYIGKPLIANGVTFITVGYDLAPEVSITEIMRQSSRAVEKIIEMTEEKSCRDVYLAGHSAGGQLALMSVLGMEGLMSQSARHVKGFILLSSILDLRLVQWSSENKVLGIDDVESQKYSATNSECIGMLSRHLSHARYLIVLPEHDAPEFWRQGKYFHQALLEKGMKSEFLEVKGRDHFDFMEKLYDQDNDLTMKILNFIKDPEQS